jgi:putative transposase
MPGPRAVKIELSEAQQQILEQMVRQRHIAQGLVSRAQIILGAAAGQSNSEIGRRLKQHRLTVLMWRKRWAAASEPLAAVEAGQDEKQTLAAVIEQVLQDAWRSGRPDTFSAEQVVQIVAISCEDPSASGLPITRWTAQDIAQEAIRRGIVDRISPQSVDRFLK